MPRDDIEFKTRDGVTLRGWFYTPETAAQSSVPLPCILLAPGFSAVKEMGLDRFARYFVGKLPVSCVVYDQRGYGASDNGDGEPRQETIPTQQIDDMSDAISYAQSRKDIDEQKIALWGSSYCGGHVLSLAAVDRRVKAVLSQVPFISGSRTFAKNDLETRNRLNDLFSQDRLARAEGKPPVVIPAVSPDESALCVMPTRESYEYFTDWAQKSPFKNEVTLRSLELLTRYEPYDLVPRISPTPLLLTVGSTDDVTPVEFALDAFDRAGEPKELHILEACGHFDSYDGELFNINIKRQVDFLKRMFLA
ncbi:DltD N-terminal domain protein [Boeremia exigua]|uniref:DltD N-terminal domain protein n=1 Tax=Boeremia exigua TaxID=749465 RepID=UPI001E8E078F|nr:DltD N-terminal domain protein [Boeremia exigua]KAH6643494.1 DltD N-terminal domain protein [Boeremia exigua]